ncbi:MAG TPA: YciI family protein [Thermomicrobiales bacterium]|nr:YciI family protein [Thermomicrobiales bacterium]
MQYLCLIYQDEAKLRALSAGEYDALIAETLDYRDELQRGGHLVASNALELTDAAMSIRVRGNMAYLTDGPFVETKEQLGGYLLIEARDFNEAIRVATRFPPARLGGIEVRPVRVHAHPESATLVAGVIDSPVG